MKAQFLRCQSIIQAPIICMFCYKIINYTTSKENILVLHEINKLYKFQTCEDYKCLYTYQE